MEILVLFLFVDAKNSDKIQINLGVFHFVFTETIPKIGKVKMVFKVFLLVLRVVVGDIHFTYEEFS